MILSWDESPTNLLGVRISQFPSLECSETKLQWREVRYACCLWLFFLIEHLYVIGTRQGLYLMMNTARIWVMMRLAHFCSIYKHHSNFTSEHDWEGQCDNIRWREYSLWSRHMTFASQLRFQLRFYLNWLYAYIWQLIAGIMMAIDYSVGSAHNRVRIP